MSERDVFEAWSAATFGPKPPGDRAEFHAAARRLQASADAINEWNTKYDAALAAWHERHHRDNDKERGGT